MGQLGLSGAMTPTKLISGKQYRLKMDLQAFPRDFEAVTMTKNPPIPAGTIFIAWPYLGDPEVDQKIADAGRVSGHRYDFALFNEDLPAGCCRFYRTLAEQLEEAATEI